MGLDQGFAGDDQLTSNAAQMNRMRYALPTISTFYGIVIRMFYNDHAPPHFHVQYGEFQAEMAIETLQVLAGRPPRRALGMTLEWAASHRADDTDPTPGVRCLMHYDVIQVKPLGHLRLAVWFRDGLRGEVELRESHLYGVFEALKDPELFQHVRCDQGFVEWPGELDLAPDAMYEAIKQHGRWILE